VRLKVVLVLVPLASLIAGCGSFPAAAPTAADLEASARTSDPEVPNFPIVKLTPAIVSIMEKSESPGFNTIFPKTAADISPALLLHDGDTVAVTVYEAGANPLFGPPAQPVSINTGQAGSSAPQPTTHTTTLPPEAIEPDGTISVPFAGRVLIAGKTLSDAGDAIAAALKGKASEPQIIVTLVDNASNSVMVGGDVGKPGLVPLTPRGERILDVIAEAAGAKYPDYETYVQLIRGRTTGKVLMQRVLSDPSENIHVRPYDQIFLARNPQTFAVLGATQHVATYNFNAAHVTLAEAVARGGGPLDTVGDIAGIYLLRFEPPSIARQVQAAAGGPPLPEGTGPVPVAYRLNLRDASQYFLAKAIAMHDKDIVLVTDAPAVPLQKLVVLLRGVGDFAHTTTQAIQDLQ